MGGDPQSPKLYFKVAHRNGAGQSRIAVLAVAPGVLDNFFEYAAANYDGLVLRCYGSGTVPNTAGLARALQFAAKRAVPIIAVSQCPEGGMSLGTYAAAAILRENGVVDGRDMTVEAAYSKLAYTLAFSASHERRLERLKTSLCGEFTP